MLPAVLEIRHVLPVALDHDYQLARQRLLVRYRRSRRNVGRCQYRDVGRGQLREIGQPRITHAALEPKSGRSLLHRKQEIWGRKLLKKETRGKKNAVEQADTLQSPNVGISSQQQSACPEAPQ